MDAPAWLKALAAHRDVAAVALAVTGYVAGSAAAGSFQHQYEQAVRYGQAHWDAALFPGTVDGMIIAATLVIWHAARRKLGLARSWPGYLVLALGIAVTVTINLSPNYPSWAVWLRPGIYAWPAVAFAVAFEMAVWLRRMNSETEPAAAEAQPAAEHAGEVPAGEPASPGPGTPRQQGEARRARRPRPASPASKRSPAWQQLPADELAARVRAATGRNALAKDLGCSRPTADRLLTEHGANGHRLAEV